jgi:hypothetical protein
MILRDAFGDVEVPLGQLFEYRSDAQTLATLEVVCTDSAMSTTMVPIICVRLVRGLVEKDGQRVGIAENGARPLFLFTGELVADLVRCYRNGQPTPIGAGEQQRSQRSARKKGKPQHDQQTSENLF